MRPHRPAQRGVSLIEALIALVIMAFGMLGIVGVQSTLRLNSDVAKQRSEAVRLAQQAIEDSRAFVEVALPASAGVPNYGNVVTQTQVIDATSGYTTSIGTVLPVYSTNTSYTLASTVTPSGDAGDSTDPRLKTLQVSVGWLDRAGATQSVVLNTSIARIMPELSGTLALAADVDANGVPTRGAHGRNPAIPYPAVNFGNGTSGYIPPGRADGDATAFRFDNLTALITLCTTAVASNALLTASSQLTCTSATCLAALRNGRFRRRPARLQRQLNPSGTAQSVQVGLIQTFPGGGVGAPACYTTAP